MLLAGSFCRLHVGVRGLRSVGSRRRPCVPQAPSLNAVAPRHLAWANWHWRGGVAGAAGSWAGLRRAPPVSLLFAMKQETPRHIPRSCCKFRAKATGVPATPPKSQQQRRGGNPCGNLRKPTALDLRKRRWISTKQRCFPPPQNGAEFPQNGAESPKKTALDLRKTTGPGNMARSYKYIKFGLCFTALALKKGEKHAPRFVFGRLGA